jgi:ferritin-like metal-binding protein YciE
MATSTLGSSTTAGENIRSIFITAVKNTHALEKEARQILSRQIERLENYPEMETLLRKHLDETNQQEERLDGILDALGEDRSVLKDWVTQIMGNAAAIAHAPATDEILKNTFANHAFENFEIAAYKSLITITEAAGESRFLPALQQSLKEEETTARLIYDQIEPITRKYLQREAAGQKADR